MAMKLGFAGKLYVGNPGADGAEPTTYSELKNVKDVSINLSRDRADVTTRAAQGYKVEVATLASLSIEFESIWDSEDAALGIVKSAYFDNSVIWVKALDSGNGSGVKFPASVADFSLNQPLAEAQTVRVTLVPTYHTVGGDYAPPSWVGATEP